MFAVAPGVKTIPPQREGKASGHLFKPVSPRPAPQCRRFSRHANQPCVGRPAREPVFLSVSKGERKRTLQIGFPAEAGLACFLDHKSARERKERACRATRVGITLLERPASRSHLALVLASEAAPPINLALLLGWPDVSGQSSKRFRAPSMYRLSETTMARLARATARDHAQTIRLTSNTQSTGWMH